MPSRRSRALRLQRIDHDVFHHDISHVPVLPVHQRDECVAEDERDLDGGVSFKDPEKRLMLGLVPKAATEGCPAANRPEPGHSGARTLSPFPRGLGIRSLRVHRSQIVWL